MVLLSSKRDNKVCHFGIQDPDIPAPKSHKMTLAQEMDMARTLERLDQSRFTSMPPLFKAGRSSVGGRHFSSRPECAKMRSFERVGPRQGYGGRLSRLR